VVRVGVLNGERAEDHAVRGDQGQPRAEETTRRALDGSGLHAESDDALEASRLRGRNERGVFGIRRERVEGERVMLQSCRHEESFFEVQTGAAPWETKLRARV